MTGAPVGLDPAGQANVARLLCAALDRLLAAAGPDRAVDQSVAVGIVGDLVERVAVDSGNADDGLFELAAACADLIGGDVARHRRTEGSPVRYGGHGSKGGTEVSLAPGTPVEYTVNRFVTAIFAGDRQAAWAVWQPIAPGGSGSLGEHATWFLVRLMVAAYSEHAGGEQAIIDSPSGWPPTCDFCDTRSAGRWMWHVVGSDVTVRHPNGQTRIYRRDDFEFWFACALCRPHIARKQPDWEPVWARYRRNNPRSQRADVQRMYRIFERLRRHVVPVPVPPQRPLPTPGRAL